MLIVIAPIGLWLAYLAGRAAWRTLRAVPKRNADFGIC